MQKFKASDNSERQQAGAKRWVKHRSKMRLDLTTSILVDDFTSNVLEQQNSLMSSAVSLLSSIAWHITAAPGSDTIF